VLQEQLELISQRSMQSYLPVGAPTHLHAPLELALVGCGDGDRKRRAQERRFARGLQVGEQIPRLLRALVAEVADALLARGLCAHDLVGVLDLATRDPQRELVRQEARVERQIDPERQAFRRREHELRARSREVDAFRQRPHHELRLPADASLGLDPQPAPAVFDISVRPAHHVGFQWREHRFAVPLEGERARLVQFVEHGLAETATESATNQPLELDPPGRAHRQVLLQACMRAVCEDAGTLELPRSQQPPVARGEGVAERLPPRARMPPRGFGQDRRDVARRLAQAHEQEHSRRGRPDAR
jgi:hypothetical protein